MKNFEVPKKPATQKQQVALIWDILTNHVLTRLRVQDMKLGFLIALAAINVALLGIILIRFII